MATYRPTFRTSLQSRPGGGTSVVTNGVINSRQRATPKSHMSQTMRLMAKTRNMDGSGQAMVALNQLNALNDLPSGISHPLASAAPLLPQEPPRDLVQENLRRENFEEFTARMMRKESDEAMALGQEVHAALLELANGMNPMSQQERKRQLQRKLSERLEANKTKDENGPQTDDPSSDPSVLDAAEQAAFVSTFGNGLGRMSLQDLEAFKKRNNMWKSTMKSTVEYLQMSKNPSVTDNKTKRSENLPTPKKEGSQGMEKEQSQGQGRTSSAKVTTDLDQILQRGSALLMASAALRPRTGSKEKDSKPGDDGNKPIEYIPPSKNFIDKAKKGRIKLPVYDRINSMREDALKTGTHFDEDIAVAVRKAAREMKDARGPVFGATSKSGNRSKPFDGIKISSLVGNKIARSKGIRQKELGPQDNMNPLQLKLVQGLEDAELSSFLENHGRRNPTGAGMQIIPGIASDPNSQNTFNMNDSPKIPSPNSEILSFEPKFRNLPLAILDRFGEDPGAVKKREAATTPRPKDFANLGPKFNALGEKNKSTSKKFGVESLKKLSFMDVTKSEFIRQMRKHQSQFQQMKSKDEMRKAFPKTYILPKPFKK